MSPTRVAVHRRLGVQLGFAVAVVVAMAFALVSGFVVRRERETLTREFTLRLLAETRSLAVAMSGPLLRHDPELDLHPLVLKSLEEMPDLADLVVVDSQGRIQGHRELLRVGSRYEEGATGTPVLVASALEGETVRAVGDEIVLEHTIRHLGQSVGRLIARVSRASVEHAVRDSQRRLAVLGLLATILAVLTVVGMVRVGLRPLGELRRAVLRLGSGDLAVRVQVRSRNELELFGDLLNNMATGLQRAQDDLIQKERIERELEIAHELQSILLPRTRLEVAGYDIECRYASALEVGGDYYDVIPLGTGRLCFVAADVSGKGIPGLVIMSMLRTVLHERAHPGMQPIDVLTAANGMLRGAVRRGMFVTCHMGILDLATGIYRYVSAGHCPPVLFGHGNAEILPAGGKPLGCFADSLVAKSFVERSSRLEDGDGLFLYTDGLTEAMNSNNETLGIEPLIQRLRQDAGGVRHATPGAEARASSGEGGTAQLAEDLLAQVGAHRGDRAPSDDVTLIVLRRQRSPVVASTGGQA